MEEDQKAEASASTTVANEVNQQENPVTEASVMGTANGGEPVVATAEAPVKKELTPEERANHMRMVIRQGIGENMAAMKALTDKIKEAGLQSHVYSSESTVVIPGQLFAHLANFMATVENHNQNVIGILSDLLDAAESITLGALDFQVALAEKHIEYCEAGIATPAPAKEPVLPLHGGKVENKEKAKGSSEILN